MPAGLHRQKTSSFCLGVLLLSGFLGGLSLPALSFAQEKPTPEPTEDEATAAAKKLFAEGQKEFKKNNFKRAAELWEQAYDLKALPLFLYNISLAYERLGDKEAAIFYSQRFVDAQPTDQELAGKVKENIQTLSKTVSRNLSISVNPPTAQISIDGQAPVAGPLELTLPLGIHKIKVTQDGYEPHEQDVRVWLDPLFPITITLKETIYDVHIKGLLAEAQVKLDGLVVEDPRTLKTTKGKHTLEITAVGYEPFRAEFTVTGEKDVVVADLQKEGLDQKLLITGGIGAGSLVSGSLGLVFAIKARNTFFLLDQNPELRIQENISLGKRQAVVSNLFFGGAVLGAAGAAAFYFLQPGAEQSAMILPQEGGFTVAVQGTLPGVGGANRP